MSQASSFAWAASGAARRSSSSIARAAVGEGARGGEGAGHPPGRVAGEPVVGELAAELPAVLDVLGGLLERRRREPAGAPAGLEPPGGEAGHLEVEAAALSGGASDQ